MKWTQRIINVENEKAFIAQGKSKLLSRLLAQRNIPVNKADVFLKNEYDQLSHPYDLKGVKEASELFCKVALKKGVIGVAADYDFDGCCSAAMIYELCSVFGLKCKVFLPSRENGYGLNEKNLECIKETFKTPIDLMFITDCGSSNENEIIALKKLTKHIIVIDHHIPDQAKLSKSADVLINWHLQDDFLETCACGEVFHFIRGIRWLTKKVNPINFLSMAAMGVLADVSPIIGDNRIIVKGGLNPHTLNNITSSGLNALLRKSGINLDNVSQEDILFKIAPKINAAGRIASPDLAYRLLIEHNPEIAEDMADNLTKLNDERKKIQKTIENEAIDIVEGNVDKYKHGILVFKPEWKAGVIGIVASRLVKEYSVPSIVICKHGDLIKGSGRSLENINLKEILDDCKHMFSGHGGHSLAVGVTLKPEFLDSANEVFNEACEKYYKKNTYPKGLSYYDVGLSPKLINLETAKLLLETMYPYCNRYNPEPIFLLKDAIIEDAELNEIGVWKILSFYASKNGEKTSIQFKTFTTNHGAEITGSKADIYFSFPQTIENNRFNQAPTLNVIDIEVKG